MRITVTDCIHLAFHNCGSSGAADVMKSAQHAGCKLILTLYPIHYNVHGHKLSSFALIMTK